MSIELEVNQFLTVGLWLIIIVKSLSKYMNECPYISFAPICGSPYGSVSGRIYALLFCIVMWDWCGLVCNSIAVIGAFFSSQNDWWRQNGPRGIYGNHYSYPLLIFRLNRFGMAISGFKTTDSLCSWWHTHMKSHFPPYYRYPSLQCHISG